MHMCKTAASHQVSHGVIDRIAFRVHKTTEVAMLQPAGITVYEYCSPGKFIDMHICTHANFTLRGSDQKLWGPGYRLWGPVSNHYVPDRVPALTCLWAPWV